MPILKPTEDSLRLDYSSKNYAHECLRKYFLSYILDLKSDYGSSALRYGSVWHSTMEAFYAHIKDNGWSRDGGAVEAAINAANKSWKEETRKHFMWYEDYRTLENLLHSFMRYIDHFVGDENHLKVISVEKPFKLPMELSEKDQKSFPHLEPFWFTGIVDMEIYYDGRYWQLDHKTTGQSLAQQVYRLNRSAQSIGYSYAGRQVFREIPEGHFITIHHIKATKSKKTGLYGKVNIDFARTPMIYGEEDIISWRQGFLEMAQRIQIAKRVNNFPCEHGSCYTYGKCGFSDICDLNLTEDEIAERLQNQGFEGFHVGEHWDPAKGL